MSEEYNYEEELKEYNRQIEHEKGKKVRHVGCVFYAMAGVMLVAAAVMVFAGRLTKNDDTGSNTVTGISSTELTGTETETEKSVSYILYADKEKMAEMDAHTWITYMTGILADAAAEDQPWAVVLFGDGTGIFVPEADIYAEGIYAKITDDGTVEEEYGQILVNGGNVSYTEYDGSVTRSMQVIDLIGMEYYNDATYAAMDELDNGQTSISIYVETSDDPEETAEIIAERLMELNPYMITLSINGESYVWMEDTGVVTAEEAESALLSSLEVTDVDTEDTIPTEEAAEILKKYGLLDD